MKTILLLRHAKSSWKNERLSDKERPLNKRGLSDASKMAKRFVGKNIWPDLIISSSSKRTLLTIEYFRKLIESEHKFISSDQIYLASSEELLEVLANINEQFKIVMLVCHNPGITDLTNYLSNKFVENVPTCGLVGFAYNGLWSDIKQNSCEFLFFDYPKILI